MTVTIPRQSLTPYLLVIIAALSLGLYSLMWYQGTISDTEETSSPVYDGHIVIGYAPWPGHIGLIVADESGFFADEGLDVELRPYDSLALLSDDYRSGVLDGRANLTFEAVHEAAEGFDHQIVLLIDHSAGSDGIIAGPEIRNVADLAGKTVGYEFGTLEEYFLTHALEDYGLTIDDIIGNDLNPDRAADALVAGTVDAAVTYEPFMSVAATMAGGSVIYSSADDPTIITNVLTFNNEFIAEHPDAVAAILRGYFTAIDYIGMYPENGEKILAESFNTTADDVARQLEGVRIGDADANRTAFTFAGSNDSLYGHLRFVKDFIRRVGETFDKYGNIHHRVVDTDDLVNALFVKEYLRTQTHENLQ